jgi:integrase
MLPGRTALDLDSGGHWTCWKRSAGIARTVVTFATWLEDGGIPTRVIDELMGHRGGARREWEASRIGLRYRHTTDEMHRRVVAALDERLAAVLARVDCQDPVPARRCGSGSCPTG